MQSLICLILISIEFGYDSGKDTIIAAGFNAGGDFHNAVAASADTAAAGTRTGS